jgi:hypothetical protein
LTTKPFTATAAGPICADVISHIGTVNVTVDPTLKNALITVSTPDEEGPVADAVRDTEPREYTANGVRVLEIRVPKVNGGGTFINGNGFSTTTMSVGGSSFTFSGNGGVSMVGGDIYMGGRKIVSNGRVVAEQGTVVGGASGSGTVTVDVRLPELSSVRLDTTSADLEVLRGDLQVLDISSVSGDVLAKGVHTLRGNLTSGDVEVERVEAKADVTTVSGDVEIGAYSGSDFRANAVSGDIKVSVTPAATGFFTVGTVSGDIEARGSEHLDPRLSTVSGRVRPRR